MKITPIEIRQHTFEKSLRGYRVDDVDAFLSSLSQEWERVVGEGKMLKMQLELVEKELNKLKEIELTLFRTLKNAEDSSAQIAEQANRQAEQYIAEMRQKADEQLAVARKKSAVMIQDAESQSRYVRENLSVELKSLEQDFKAMERYKDNLMVQIRALATNAMDSVDRFEKKFARQSAKQKFDEVGSNQVTPETPVTEVQPKQEERQPELQQVDIEATNNDRNEQPNGENISEQVMDNPAGAGQAVPELPADAEVPTDLPTNAQQADEPVALSGADASAHHADAPALPEPQTEQAGGDEKKGGSFFDQI